MSRPTVIAIASGKGGVGKTTTTVNLGTALAKEGNRVVLVDVDLGMANLAEFVSLHPEGATLHDVLIGESGLKDATYRLTEGLFAIPSSSDLESYSELSAGGLPDVVTSLRDAFDYILLDIGAGVHHETFLSLGIADGTLLVTTPAPGAVKNTVFTVDLVDKAGGTVVGLILNRVHPGENVDVESIAGQFPCELMGTIPEDPAVRGSVRSGQPVVAYDADSMASKAFLELATRLSGTDLDDDDTGGTADAETTDGSTGEGTDEASHDEISERLSDLDDAEEAEE